MAQQPSQNQIHVDRPLTNISVAYIQNDENFIASQVFPVIPVDKASDQYYTYTKEDWFRDEAQPRAAGTESAGGGYRLGQDNYSCTVYAFHKDIPAKLRSNADAGIDLDRDATELVSQKLLLRRERIWANRYFRAGVWGTTITGVSSSPSTNQVIQWSDYTSSTPTTDVDTARETIALTTGFQPNTLVLGFQVFNKLKRHPLVRDQYKYTNSDVVTADMLARLFEVERVLVAKAVVATNNEGETSVFSFVQGKGALLCYSNPRPSLLAPSGGYTFGWTGVSQGMGKTVAIKTFPMPWLDSDRVEGEDAFDCKLVGADLGVFWDGIVA